MTEDLTDAIARSVMALAHYALRDALALAPAMIIAAPLAPFGARERAVELNSVAGQAAALFDALARAARRGGFIPDA